MSSIKKYRYILLAAIVICQILLIIYWGGRRENYYWDEYFTFEKAHYISKTTQNEHYIIDDKEYKENTWLPISVVKSTLVVTKDNSIINDGVGFILKRLIGYNNYAVYLNIFETLFSSGRLSMWPAIVLNIVFFVCIQLLLFAMAYSLTKSEVTALFTVLFYGFSSMSMSMATFVRFYVLATLFTVLFVFFHLQYWRCEPGNHVKKALYLGLSFAFLYLGFQGAQYVIIFGAFFVMIFSLIILVFRKWKQFLYYAVPIYGGGLYYIVTQTDYLDLFFDFEGTYSNTDGAMQWVMEQIIDFSPAVLPTRIDEMCKLIGRYMFGSYFVMLLFIFLIVCAVVTKALKKKKMIGDENAQFMIVVSGSLLLFLMFFTMFGLYDQPRYISYIFPIIALLVMYVLVRAYSTGWIAYMLMLLLAFTQIVSVNLKEKVDMLYVGDRAYIEAIRNVDADSIMLYAGSGAGAVHMVYQSVLFVDDDAEFFSYNGKDLDAAKDALRDGMLLVFENSTEHEEFDNMIRDCGYGTTDIGWTYKFSVQQISKNNQ